MVESHQPVVDQILTKHVYPLLQGDSKSTRLLDVGCGVGYVLRYLINHGGWAVGIDPARQMLIGNLPTGVTASCELLPFRSNLATLDDNLPAM